LARETEVLGGNPTSMPLCAPQIPHGLPWDYPRMSAVRNLWLTGRPSNELTPGRKIIVDQLSLSWSRNLPLLWSPNVH